MHIAKSRWVAGVFLLSCVLAPSTTQATPQLLCGIYDDGCCVICNLTECTTAGTHPEDRCNKGSMLHSLDVDQAKCSAAGIANGAAYCAQEANHRTVGLCNPFDHSSETEVVNGRDDRCDGVTLADERCDGRDDDFDGRIDEGAGSCLERHLFVPVCWNGGDQTDFNNVVKRWETFFQDRTLLEDCGEHADVGAKKIWYEAAPIGEVPCPAGATSAADINIPDLMLQLKATRNLKDWDYVSFATRLPTVACIAGSTGGGGVTFLTSDGYTTPRTGEFAVFAHEWGHNVGRVPLAGGGSSGGLVDEYLDVVGPNRVSAALGCDPTTCCTGAHCNPSANGKLCNGNDAKNVSNWDWNDPTDPPTFGDHSACIMSNASAPDFGTVNQVTTSGSHRGWCQACLNHIDQFGPKCDHTYAGPRRRLEIFGKVSSVTGLLEILSYDVGEGRMGGGAPQGGPVQIEMYDSAGAFLGMVAPEPAGAEPFITSGDTVFLSRMPLSMPVAPGPITFIGVKDGVPVSQVTGGGSPAVAIANDVIAECTSSAGTAVALDGSQSFDPDSDTLTFAWTSNLPLSNANAAIANGSFPLGTSQVSLSVDDGTRNPDVLTIAVTVRDTTGPTLQVANVSAQTCVPEPRVVALTKPVVGSECGGAASVTFTAELISVRGKALATPIALDAQTPSVTVPVGASIVRWTGTDASGNRTQVLQTVGLALNETATVCCGTKTVLEGTTWPDIMLRPFSGEFCMFGRGSIDTLVAGPGADFLSGGPGNDLMTGGSNTDVMLGGDGNDTMTLPLGNGAAYGGAGNDTLQMTGAGVMYGNAGDDTIIGIFGDHVIYPGAGRDAVTGGPGNDIVRVHDVCELSAFETLDGSLGSDTLYLPEPLANVQARGVIVLGFEQIIVTSSNRHLAECF